MAQEIVAVRLVDDLDRKTTADETLSYHVDGQWYEIDLAKKHAQQFRSDLDKYIVSSRKVGRRSNTTPAARAHNGARTRANPSKRTPLPAGQETIRAWAKSKKIAVNERGRIPNSIIKQFAAASANGDAPSS